MVATQVVPERLEDLAEIALNAMISEASTSCHVAAASEGGLGAGLSGQPIEGISWMIVQPGVPEDFLRTEHEEDEIWQVQLDLGEVMDTDLQRVLQVHWEEKHNVNRVGALPAPVHFDYVCTLLLMFFIRSS